MKKKKRRKKKAGRRSSFFAVALLLSAFGFFWQRGQSRSSSQQETIPIFSSEESLSGSPQRKLSIKGNERIRSFSESKKLLAGVFEGMQYTFYCDCAYSLNRVDWTSCGFQPFDPRLRDRAARIEWEHIVPASRFGRTFKEWSQGHPSCTGKRKRGRQCAEKASAEFRRIEADMYNLAPAIGEVNAMRENFPFGELPASISRMFGACETRIANNVIDPRPAIRGWVARAYFYMEKAYSPRVQLSDAERKMFTRWNHEHPVNDKEKERASRIERIQGNKNPFIVGDATSLQQHHSPRSNISPKHEEIIPAPSEDSLQEEEAA